MILLFSAIASVLLAYLAYREGKRGSREVIRNHYRAILIEERAFSLQVRRERLERTNAPLEEWDRLLEKYRIDKDDPFV